MYIEVILGVIFGIVFGKKYFNFFYKDIVHGPNSNKTMNTLYHDDKNNKYYKFIPEICIQPLMF